MSGHHFTTDSTISRYHRNPQVKKSRFRSDFLNTFTTLALLVLLLLPMQRSPCFSDVLLVSQTEPSQQRIVLRPVRTIAQSNSSQPDANLALSNPIRVPHIASSTIQSCLLSTARPPILIPTPLRLSADCEATRIASGPTIFMSDPDCQALVETPRFVEQSTGELVGVSDDTRRS